MALLLVEGFERRSGAVNGVDHGIRMIWRRA